MFVPDFVPLSYQTTSASKTHSLCRNMEVKVWLVESAPAAWP